MEVQPTPTTLARIYRDHCKKLRKKLVREGVRFPDVDDVIHQTFSELHRDLAADADKPRDLVAWVYAAAHHKAVDYVRYHHLRAEMHAPGDLDELLGDIASPALDAAEQLLNEERRRFLREALQHMSPERRIVLEHRIYDELTVAQIAVKLGLPESTVRARFDAAWRDLEDAYSRWRAENERREGALVLPVTLAALLGFSWLSDAGVAAGGPQAFREAGSGVPATWMGSPAFASPGNTLAPEWGASSNPSAQWRGVLTRVLVFLSGVVVGAAVLWFLIYKIGFIDPSGRRRADETRGILSMVDPSKARSIDVPRDTSSMAPAPPVMTSNGVMQLPPSSVLTPSQPTRRAERPMSEQDLISTAQSAIRDGKADLARSMLARHAKEFPDGSLKDTRDSLLAVLPPVTSLPITPGTPPPDGGGRDALLHHAVP